MEPKPGCIVGPLSFLPIKCPIFPFNLLQPSSHLTLLLYAKRSAHPDILMGTHEMPIPLASQSGSFFENFFLFKRLNISRADIPCVLENEGEEAARSTQPVTLYITVKITPPNMYNNPTSTPTKVDGSLAEGATIPGRIRFPVPENHLPLLHHQSWEEISPIRSKNPRFHLHRADGSMKRIVRIDGSNTWERALRRIKWVMDTLGPIAEVRV